MSITTDLMDRVRQSKNLSSDAALAKLLGSKPSTMSGYRQGVRHAEPELVKAMATLLKEDPEVWVLRVQAEREIVPARKQVWLRAAERLAATAALIALGVGIAPNVEAMSNSHLNAQTAIDHFVESASSVYYVKSYRDA